MSADPYRELRSIERKQRRRIEQRVGAPQGDTLIGRSPWSEPVDTTIAVTGNTETEINAAKLWMPVTTPSNQRMRFRVFGLFTIASNGGASEVLFIAIWRDGAPFGAVQHLGPQVYPVSTSVTFDLEGLAFGLHTYTLAWNASDPANTRQVTVGPSKTLHFDAWTRP